MTRTTDERKAYQRDYREANRARINERKKIWRAANLDRCKEYANQYNAKNYGAIKERDASRSAAPNSPSTYSCRQCKTEKPFTEEFFPARNSNKWKLSYQCRVCASLAAITNITKSKYGITYEEAKTLRSTACRICGAKGRLHIDHCHKSGNMRSVLCSSCNHGLGNFRDSPDLLRQAALYLEAYEAQ